MGARMKFGLQHPNYTYDGQGPQLVDGLKKLVTQAENLGFDSFWVMDHFHQIQYVGQPGEPMLEGWTTQGVVAGFTSRIKIGTLVTGIVYRHPAVLAKIGATLDVLSKGRLFMGIGAAWNEEEAAAYGIPFPATEERMQRLEESCADYSQNVDGRPSHFRRKILQDQRRILQPKTNPEATPANNDWRRGRTHDIENRCEIRRRM